MLLSRSLSGPRRWTLVGLLTLVLALCAALLPALPAHASGGASLTAVTALSHHADDVSAG